MENSGCSKDSPDIYEHAVKRLGLKPWEVAVIEDMSVGARCARSLGCFSIGIYDKNHKEETSKMKKTAELFVNNFEELLKIMKNISD
ncbi:MAG: HAD-IA family hydrolase [Bacilli bacterium]|nr:HAD-IA family hydrolase [Bacilli bacterium]